MTQFCGVCQRALASILRVARVFLIMPNQSDHQNVVSTIHEFCGAFDVVDGRLCVVAWLRTRFDFVIHCRPRDNADVRFFHTFGYYEVVLHRATTVGHGWVIESIAQHALRNEGDPELHGTGINES
jgi:hypothetical protein